MMTSRRIQAAGGAAALLAGGWAVRDYRRWRALGVGGLPPTWRGWLETTRLRLLQRDPFRLSETDVSHAEANLTHLPRRAGERPRVGPHPVPHRQLTQHAPARVLAALDQAFADMVAAEPDRLVFAKSHFEKHNAAVTLRADASAGGGAANLEIGHIHPSDGSMHMILAPADADLVITRRWGERHGLAGVAFGLPLTYMLIYAPRNAAEVEVAARILAAAVRFVEGREAREATITNATRALRERDGDRIRGSI